MSALLSARTRNERLDALAALLSLEEAEAKARQRALVEGKSDRALEADGIVLRKARVTEERPALFGRARVTFGEDPSRPGHLDTFAVRPGSVVHMRAVDEDGAAVPGARGVVALKRARELVVVFDEPPELDDEQVSLVRDDDDVTLRRLKSAVAAVRAAKGRAGALVDILVGLAAPSPSRDGALTPLDDALNADQARAVKHALYAPDVALVHGPPGTGKTRVLVEVVRQLVARGERVLCLTASNTAIDNLAIGLIDADPALPLARAGHPARVHPALEAHTLQAKTENHERKRLAKDLVDQAFKLLRGARRRSDSGREAWQREREARVEAGRLFADARQLERQAVDEVLRTTRVLCGTLTGFSGEVPDAVSYDTLVVDEASQALLPAVLLGATRVSRVVLAGDHRQLPPTILSLAASKGGLDVTAFDLLMRRDDHEQYAHMLTVQHRMHEALMTFPSAQFYDGRLKAHPSVAHHVLADLGVRASTLVDPTVPLDVIDTAGSGLFEEVPEGSESRANPGEGRVVQAVVDALVESGLAPKDIGVITPYAAQVAWLATALGAHLPHGLEIDSVDGFQGREKEAIVFSAVRSNPDGEIGFTSDRRRLNVAITRARRKLTVVVDSATLGVDETWSGLVASASERGLYRSVFELPGVMD